MTGLFIGAGAGAAVVLALLAFLTCYVKKQLPTWRAKWAKQKLDKETKAKAVADAKDSQNDTGVE